MGTPSPATFGLHEPVVNTGAPGAFSQWLGWSGIGLTAILSITPLLIDGPPISFLSGHDAALVEWAGRLCVILAMLGAVAVRAWADRDREPWWIALGLVALSGLMAGCHYLIVDSDPTAGAWQRATYLKILNHTADAPHQYRALPYGFVRLLEHVTGDWLFVCLVYRWFFSYWFVWAWQRFAQLFLDPLPALATLGVLVVYYPLSIQYYWGQLTDPLSHALFTLALIYTVRDRWWALAAVLALGVLAKETAILIVPVYLACYWRSGLPALGKTVGLGLVGTAAFLAARLPLGWRPGAGTLNGVERLMIGYNLGLDRLDLIPLGPTTYVPLAMNYLHPLVFVVPFVPFVIRCWRQTDARLKAIFLTLTPLLLLSNLCFGWLYESRNYVPLLPVLTTMAVPGLFRRWGGGQAVSSAG